MVTNGGPGTEGFRPLEDGDPRMAGGYRLMARIGSGGMGRVYLSYTPGGRAVAVKVIRPELAEDPEFRRRFRAEVAAASRVHGLYTAPVVDSDTEGSMPWCATAYVPGPSLAEAVRAHGPLPVDTVLRLVAGVAEALQAVHAAGIVHRDLKPSNVLLADDGPRVIDFGVARAADATSVTQSGTAVGTVAYMAPEQVLGGEAAGSADVFALGQTAVFAATGRAAFGEGDPHAVLYRVVHEEPDLGRVPDELRDLVARCLRKPAAERPSVADVIRTVQVTREARGLDSGAWLPGELAAGIAARVEGARVAGAAPTDVGSAAPSGGFGPPAAFRQEQPGGAPGHPAYAAPPAQGHPPTSPSHASLPGPFVMGQQAYGSPGPVPGTDTSSSVRTTAERGRSRVWLLAAAGVALVACGAGVALTLVPDDKGTDDAAKEPAHSRAAETAAGASPAESKSASPSASEKPKASKSAAAPGPSEPSAPSTTAPPKASATRPASPSAPAASTYGGIVMTKSHDLYLADTPVRAKADDGRADEDLTYAVYKSGAVLAPGTSSGSSLALLPAGRQGGLDACKAATGYKTYLWVKELSVGQQMCVTSGTGHVGLVTYRGGTTGTAPSATLDVKVWRNAA
ncbi:protein kinase [Streptomyces kunmingensis]|uniref:non-specific serine/threonine protein kinase n=1 Tax=Streptomyces kunmingensis TaxID=68225 RepID=A0ABU6CCQ3_9ACTN|nr:protein kinase [Streptomyces kunmingensis]MEB3961956.1 protein kinase [Streptomyces kunmingensis]